MGPLGRIHRQMCGREAARLRETGAPVSEQWAALLSLERAHTAHEVRVQGLTERTIDSARKAR